MSVEKNAAQSSALNSPHPPLECVEPSPEAVRLLLSDYASANSELTAVTSYMYQAAILANPYPAVSKALRKIGIAEMEHLELLAETIIALGGDPQYRSEVRQSCGFDYWTGAFADCSKFVRDILQNDIKAEQCAIEQYYRHADVIPIACVQALLRHIIKEEQQHIRTLSNILKSL